MHDSLSNPVWAALTGNQRAHASGTSRALRYPSDVAPFAAVENPGADELRDLSTLLDAGEQIWLVGPRVGDAGALRAVGAVDCFQLVMPASIQAPVAAHAIVDLSAADAADMVNLTTVAFPGFFRARTHLLGYYCGIRSDAGELMAMAGERFSAGSCREVSAVCTHPSARGQGLASAVMWRVIERHRAAGLVSWLHVATTNATAIRLYRSMGFVEHAIIRATRVRRA